MPSLRNCSRGHSPAYRSPVTGRHAVAPQRLAELGDDGFGGERWLALADNVQDDPVALSVTQRHRHRIVRSTGRINKGQVALVLDEGALADAEGYASLDNLASD